MHHTGIGIVAGALFVLSAAAQTQTSGQAGTQAGGQASVQAGQTKAQADATSSTSAATQTQNGQASASLANGTAFNAALTSPLDSRKCTPGDTVRAHTTEAVKSEAKTVIPKGSKLLGHVTQASARANGQADSALAIVFDKAVLKNGQEVPLNVAIQALASGQSSASAAGADLDAMGSAGGSAGGSASSGGRGALGGVTSTAGAAAGTVTNTAGRAAGGAVNSTTNAAGGISSASKGAVGGLNSAGQLSSNSQGVFGLSGLSLNAATSGATEGSVITSAGKNVHLDSGTRMLLVTQAQAGEQPAAKQPALKPESKHEPNKPEKP